jgi:hypothetical protein
MPRTPATFKQADLVRAIKSARACGLDIVRTEIAPNGRLVLIHVPNQTAPGDDLDRELAEFEARHHGKR